MSVVVTLDGLAELRAAIRNLPAALTGEARGIVLDEAEGAAAEIRAAYPVRAYGRQQDRGTLRRRVKVDMPSQTVLIATVRAQAPHAHLYEFGTQVRQTKTGANRGSSPAHPVTVPIARRHRQRMTERLIDLVRAQGAEVSDIAG